jgi:hypothetical protein
MKCPHCGIHFHDNWIGGSIDRGTRRKYGGDKEPAKTGWVYRTALCPDCKQLTIELMGASWRQVHPVGSNRGPVPPEVPKRIAADYVEACQVLPLSAKASAALSRRCLQAMLHAHGYKDRDLAREVQQLLNETDQKKVLPRPIHGTVDAIRNFGNFSAHPINDKTSLQVIDVQPQEAEWCLEILEALFEHFYVGPAAAAAKKKALDAKLNGAGKPPSK